MAFLIESSIIPIAGTNRKRLINKAAWTLYNQNVPRTQGTTANSAYAAVVLADSPGAYWRLNESSGNFLDSTGNVNTITSNFTGITYAQTGALCNDSDKSIAFSGGQTAGATLTGTTTVGLPTGDVGTWECWAKSTAIAQNRAFITQNTNGAALFIDSSNKINFNKQGVGNIALISTPLSTDKGWHHFVATKNGASVHIYLDGVDVTGTVTNLTLAPANGQTYIGSSPTTNRLTGSLDEVAVYNYALSPQRIQLHYNIGASSGRVQPAQVNRYDPKIPYYLRRAASLKAGAQYYFGNLISQTGSPSPQGPTWPQPPQLDVNAASKYRTSLTKKAASYLFQRDIRSPIPIQTQNFSTANGTTATITYGKQVVSGSLMVVTVALCGNATSPNPVVTSVACGSGEAFIFAGATSTGSGTTGIRCEVWYLPNRTTSLSNRTINVNANSLCNIKCTFAEYRGDLWAYANAVAISSGNSASAATSSVTTQWTNELVVVGIATNNSTSGSTVTFTNKFIRDASIGGTGSGGNGSAQIILGDLSPGSIGTYNTTATVTSNPWATVIVSFTNNPPPIPSPPPQLDINATRKYRSRLVSAAQQLYQYNLISQSGSPSPQGPTWPQPVQIDPKLQYLRNKRLVLKAATNLIFQQNLLSQTGAPSPQGPTWPQPAQLDANAGRKYRSKLTLTAANTLYQRRLLSQKGSPSPQGPTWPQPPQIDPKLQYLRNKRLVLKAAAVSLVQSNVISLPKPVPLWPQPPKLDVGAARKYRNNLVRAASFHCNFIQPTSMIPIQTGAGFNQGGNTASIVLPNNYKIGNLLVVSVGISGSSSNLSPTVVSVVSTGTTWNFVGAISNGSSDTGIRCEVWYATAAAAGNVITVNVSGDTANIQAVCAEYRGDLWASVDGVAVTNSARGTFSGTGNYTPNNPNDLIIAATALANDGSGAPLQFINGFANEISHGSIGTFTGVGFAGYLFQYFQTGAAAGTGTCQVVLADLNPLQLNTYNTGAVIPNTPWATVLVGFTVQPPPYSQYHQTQVDPKLQYKRNQKLLVKVANFQYQLSNTYHATGSPAPQGPTWPQAPQLDSKLQYKQNKQRALKANTYLVQRNFISLTSPPSAWPQSVQLDVNASRKSRTRLLKTVGLYLYSQNLYSQSGSPSGIGPTWPEPTHLDINAARKYRAGLVTKASIYLFQYNILSATTAPSALPQPAQLDVNATRNQRNRLVRVASTLLYRKLADVRQQPSYPQPPQLDITAAKKRRDNRTRVLGSYLYSQPYAGPRFPLGAYQRAAQADGATYLWRLNETSGAVAYESFDNNPGTAFNTTPSVFGAVITGDTSTTYNNSFSSRTDTSLQVVNPGQNGYSLEAWFRTSQLADQGIFGFRSGSNNDRQIYIGDNGAVYFGHFDGVTHFTVNTGASVYNDNNWHYIVATWDKLFLNIYIDGHLINRAQCTIGPQNYTGAFGIGGVSATGWPGVATGNWLPWNGQLQDVAYYPQALTENQVRNRFGTAIPLEVPAPALDPRFYAKQVQRSAVRAAINLVFQHDLISRKGAPSPQGPTWPQPVQLDVNAPRKTRNRLLKVASIYILQNVPYAQPKKVLNWVPRPLLDINATRKYRNRLVSAAQQLYQHNLLSQKGSPSPQGPTWPQPPQLDIRANQKNRAGLIKAAQALYQKNIISRTGSPSPGDPTWPQRTFIDVGMARRHHTYLVNCSALYLYQGNVPWLPRTQNLPQPVALNVSAARKRNTRLITIAAGYLYGTVIPGSGKPPPPPIPLPPPFIVRDVLKLYMSLSKASAEELVITVVS